MKKYDAVIIGGGAAGFFCAINIALAKPGARLLILEKTQKLLSKVRISGGGRCNITHHCFDNSELIKNYPRGSRELRQVFSRFSVRDAIQWFEDRGLRLKTEEDGRMFPATDTSQSVIDCFIGLAEKYRIGVSTGT
jgi:predicted Rossmann fold flavoprotein